LGSLKELKGYVSADGTTPLERLKSKGPDRMPPHEKDGNLVDPDSGFDPVVLESMIRELQEK
jgi:hypothetical protein